MPSFDTPAPIAVSIEFPLGDARITAADRADTVVEVRPSDPSHELDVRAAEQTRVEYEAGRLLVIAPKARRLGLFAKPGSIEVTIALPANSTVQGDAGAGNFRCDGRLGECRVKTGAGDLYFAGTGTLNLSTGAGAVTVDRVAGNADVATGSGWVRLREVAGTAVVKNSNGDNWIGDIAGDLQVSTANGDISVDHAHGRVSARTANGDIQVGGLVRGATSLKTAYGEIKIGIRPGTAAQLDVSTNFGIVRNELAATERPEPSDETAEVHAHTDFGDIVIHQS